MNNLFVPIEIAERLAKLGFNEPCFGFYHPSLVNSDLMLTTALDYTWDSSEYCTNSRLKFRELQPQITAPVYSQIIDWFRENHRIVIDVFQESQNYQYTGKWKVDISEIGNYQDDEFPDPPIIQDSYYLALEKGIELALETIKNQKILRYKNEKIPRLK